VATVADMYGLAVQYHQAGNLQLAEHLYRQIVQAEPAHADAWCFLGVACQSQGKLAEAEAHLARAVEIMPSHPSAGSLLGAVLLMQGKPAEAVASFRWALQHQPDNPEIKSNLGAAYGTLAHAQANQGRLQEAVSSYQNAVQWRPGDAQTHYQLGMLVAKQRKFEAAIGHYQSALRIKPDFPEAHNNFGFALQNLGRVQEAASHWREALRLRPDSPEVHNNLANVLQHEGNIEEAISHYEQALQLLPGFAAVHNNLANVLKNEGRLEEAIQHWHKALHLSPDYPEPHYNLGKELQKLGQLDEALDHYEKALRIKPDYADARWNRALLWLVRGEWVRGWPDYEMRWTQPGFTRRSFSQLRWDGSPLHGRTILLHAEQGLGDTLQFIRYAPLVKERGCNVVFECPPALRPLLSNAQGFDLLVSQRAPLPPFDVEAPLLSLPGIFQTTVATVPAPVPYLHVDSKLVEQWHSQCTVNGGRWTARQEKSATSHRPPSTVHCPLFRIGIAWQGSPTFRGDRERSIPLAQFAPLADINGIQLVSLQKGPGTEQLVAWPGQNAPSTLGSRFDESHGAFVDTAAVIMNLDLVITSDTAVAHLAGALGMPVWVALSFVPDWRWLLHLADTQWYPTMRLFRQRRLGHWEEVFQRIAEEVRGIATVETRTKQG
jgi:tetratricopeptide (TPR) repeat protein